MRKVSKMLLGMAGVAAIAGAAYAADRDVHVLNVVLPDGSVEHIHYTGKVAPRVVIAPAGPARMIALPTDFSAGGDPFAMMDRMAAEMDARTDAMQRQAAALQASAPAMNGQIDQAAFADAPAGAVSYSMTSFSSGDGAAGCSQSIQVTSLGAGQAPKVVRQSSGDCNAMNQTRTTPAVQQAEPAAVGAAKLVPARYDVPADKPVKKSGPSF